MKFNALMSRRLGLGLLGLLLLVAFAFVVARSGPLAPTRVTIAKVTEGNAMPALFGVGTVEARRSYLIGPTAAGRVLRVLADVGEPVKAGQLLAEMDPVDMDERGAAQDASMRRAANAAAAAEAQMRDAKARKELAVINTRRYVELGEKQFVSASVVEAKAQEQTSADAVLDAAQANLAAAGQDLSRLKAERAGLNQQRQNVRLYAPADGMVVSRDAETGTTVVAGQAVLKLVEPGSLWVRTRLDQSRSAGLAVGLPAEIVLRSNPSHSYPGKVARVEPLSDSVTEERIAQIAFDVLPPGLSVGELAEVTLKFPAIQSALMLPNASLRQQGGQTGVWRRENGKLRFAAVRTGNAGLEGQVQILQGLKVGDEVVVYSEKELTASSRIKVVESLNK